MEEEIWKDVVGYEGKYQVSNLGRVRSVDRIIKNSYKRGKILKPRNSAARGLEIGYSKVSLSGKNCYVHKLVAEAFIPNPFNKPHVDHIDCNVLNNRIGNLKWCTQKENVWNPITREKLMKIYEKNKYKKSKYFYNGEPLKSYCEKNNISKYIVLYRVKKFNIDIDKSVEISINNVKDWKEKLGIKKEKPLFTTYTKWFYKNMSLSRYCKENNINISTIKGRIKKGMPIEEAINKPLEHTYCYR